MWNSGIYGFRDEAALYDNTFQQYGQIFHHERRRLGQTPSDRQPLGGLDAVLIPAKFL